MGGCVGKNGYVCGWLEINIVGAICEYEDRVLV